MIINMLINNNCKYDSRVLREAGTLANAGYTVKIFAFLDDATEEIETKDGFTIKRITKKSTREIRLGINLALLYSYLRYYYNFLIRINKEKAEVYHSHDLLMLPLGFTAKLIKHCKLVYDSHELFIEQAGIDKYMKSILKFVERIMIKSADKVITVNEFIAHELSSRYKITEPTVIKNCPPLILDGVSSQTKDIRSSLNLNSNTRLILYAGGLSKGRGLNNIVHASRYIENSAFIFLGSGLYRSKLQNLVNDLKLSDKVIFLNPVLPTEFISFIRAADIGIVVFQAIDMNNYYGSPNKFFEYIAAGLPVVCSNFPFMKSIVEQYKIGVTCDPEDPEDIARAINEILSDSAKYNEFKKNTMAAARVFNWENESKKLIALYKDLHLKH